MKNYFPDSELACGCCGKVELADGFLDNLNQLREAVDHPLIPASVCRCRERNAIKGGRPGSFHLISHPWKCCAADISTVNGSSQKLWNFIEKATASGWSIGINWQKNFIHIDRRTDYDTGWDEPVFFPY